MTPHFAELLLVIFFHEMCAENDDSDDNKSIRDDPHVEPGYKRLDETGPKYERRAAIIMRMAQRLRTNRRWIGFAEIAKYLALTDGSVKPDKDKQQEVYEALIASAQERDFEHDGRSNILVLNADAPFHRLSRPDLRILTETYKPSDLADLYYSRLWVPRGMAKAWFQRQRQAWPGSFDVAPTEPVERQTHIRKRLTPKLENAMRILRELSPEILPVGSVGSLTAKVNKCLKARGGDEVSQDTVSRAMKRLTEEYRK